MKKESLGGRWQIVTEILHVGTDMNADNACEIQWPDICQR